MLRKAYYWIIVPFILCLPWMSAHISKRREILNNVKIQ